MEKISISNIVRYRRKTDATKNSFLASLKNTKVNSDTGGDYWAHAISAVSAVFNSTTPHLINKKIDVLIEKLEACTGTAAKSKYQRNIDVLLNFQHFDFAKLKPNAKLNNLPKPKAKSILVIENVPVEILPHHVFTYQENEIIKIGAIWFVAKNNGYRIEELAFFTDALYRYLNAYYSDTYHVDPQFCLALDINALNTITYTKIINKHAPMLLGQTLRSIKEALS